MNIEAELPEDFEDFSTERKVRELERLKEELGDEGPLKVRLVEEMIRTYSEKL